MNAPVLIAVASLGLATVAIAGNPNAPDDDQVEDLGTVCVVATRSERAARDIAGTVSVIDSEAIQRELVRSIDDLIRYEPGVSVSSEGNRFGLGGFTIRGIDGNRVGTEVDGVGVPHAFAVGSFANAGRDVVDPEILQRVEILRGPASTLYGSDALGGMVAYVTKDPADYLNAGQSRAFGLKAGYDGRDNSTLATATAALASERFEGLLLVSRRDGHESDIADTVSTTAANPADYRGSSVIGKLLYTDRHGNPVRLTVDHGNSERYTDVRSQVRGPGKFASTIALSADDQYDRTRVSIDQRYGLDLGWADSVRWQVFHQASDTSQTTVQDREPSGRTTYATRRDRGFQLDEDIAGVELVLTRDVATNRVAHHVVYGIEYTDARMTERRDGTETNLVDGSITHVIIGEVLPVRDFPITDTRELGLFVQDEIAIGNGDLRLIPGLRYDRYTLDPRPDSLYLADNPDTDPVSMDEHNVSPKLGVLYRPGDRWTAFAQYARGFRSPPADDVNLAFTIPLFNYVALPNPDLEPETSDGFEAGLRFESPALSMALTGYYNRYKNLIESRVNLGPDPATGALVFQSLNRAVAEIHGVEARARANLGMIDDRLDGLSVQSSVAFSRGTDEARDEPLNAVDPATLVVGLRYTPDSGRWSTQIIATAVDGKDRVDNSELERFQAPGYAIIDVVGHYDLTDRARLDIGVFNVTDRTYWRWSDVRTLGVGDPLVDLHARPGINASISLSIRL